MYYTPLYKIIGMYTFFLCIWNYVLHIVKLYIIKVILWLSRYHTSTSFITFSLYCIIVSQMDVAVALKYLMGFLMHIRKYERTQSDFSLAILFPSSPLHILTYTGKQSILGQFYSVSVTRDISMICAMYVY